MKPEHVAQLVKLRMQQAREALGAAQLLLESGRSVQGAINRSYYNSDRFPVCPEGNRPPP